MTGARRRKRRPQPSYKEEQSLLDRGFSLVAGLDEVGRGPVAGPVLAAVAILRPKPRGRWLRMVRDSKMLTARQRERVMPYLRDAALALEVGSCSAGEIDSLGIVSATRLAMRRAVDSLPLHPTFLLLDALTLPDLAIPQKAIVKGDSLCLSIAAASIVAKVSRDRIMREFDDLYPGYGFADHKGYATSRHLENLRRLGPSPIHRHSFAPVRECARSSG